MFILCHVRVAIVAISRYMGVASLGGTNLDLYPQPSSEHIVSSSSSLLSPEASPSSSPGRTPGGRPGLHDCRGLTGLVDDQLAVCQKNPAGLQYVILGARLGLMECQYQFQHERWNCTPAGKHISQTVFDQVVKRGASSQVN